MPPARRGALRRLVLLLVANQPTRLVETRGARLVLILVVDATTARRKVHDGGGLRVAALVVVLFAAANARVVSATLRYQVARFLSWRRALRW